MMPVQWPTSLIREIAARRCILFLGAGVSASATSIDGASPKTWNEFLDDAAKLILDPDLQALTRKLIDERKFLLALQAIKDHSDPADYHNLLNENFLDSSFRPSGLHEVIHRLDSRLVITTNFDGIYDRYCASQSNEGYKVVNYGSASIGDDIRSDTRLIIKAHGTIDDYQSMIFSRSQYHKMKRDQRNFYSILQALLLTHTCLFIGCGMDDPDMMLVLEDVTIVGSPQHPHYALIRDTNVNPILAEDWRRTYNIACLRYGPSHDDLVTDLENLFQLVDQHRQYRIG